MELTLEKLKNNFGHLYVDKVIEEVRKFYPPYPKNPYKEKPSLPLKHSHEDVLKYAENYKIYEEALAQYKKQTKEYNDAVKKIDAVLIEYIKDESGLNDIPKQYQNKVWSYAYQESHSDGYYAIYQMLLDLVDIFK